MKLSNLGDYYKGFVVNHLVKQELIAHPNSRILKPHYWVRENAKLNAEVDLRYKWGNLLLPIEVKSGANGSLKSLHEFMDIASHAFSLRFLGKKISME